MNYGKTRITVCKDVAELGVMAASLVGKKLTELLAKQKTVRAVFAAGESQESFLKALAKGYGIDWQRVECFNIDDFWDTRMTEQFTCGHQTTRQLYRQVKPMSVDLVQFNAPDPQAECDRYEALLRARPIDILCQGIGTSGHLALNEPGETDFHDTRWVRLVNVAEQSKRQLQVDPNFQALGYIPEKGITMTIPAILSATHCCTMVPFALKKPILTRLAAVRQAVKYLPASILLEKEGVLFVDKDSCPEAWTSIGEKAARA